MRRLLSHSEVSTALDCQAKWDFSYGGHLAGDALVPKTTAPQLRDGRAWGRAVAAFHARTDPYAALVAALDEDRDEQRKAGVYLPEAANEVEDRLRAILDHYISLTEPRGIDRLEDEIEVAIPARSGKRASNRYRFLAYLDGVSYDEEGEPWPIEFKLRGTLWPYEQVVVDRQIRRYAWAWWQANGVMPRGVIVDQRKNDVPKPVKFNKNGSVSKVQSCTPEAYTAACQEVEQAPDAEVLDALRAKEWQSCHPIQLTPSEIAEAGSELVSAGRLIHALDSGLFHPIRNTKPWLCKGCTFRSICPHPEDVELVDALFERVPPKRLRPQEEEANAVASPVAA